MLRAAIYRFGTTLKVGRVLGIGSRSAFRGGSGRHRRFFSRMRLCYHRARSHSLSGPYNEYLYDSFYKAR